MADVKLSNVLEIILEGTGREQVSLAVVDHTDGTEQVLHCL